MSSHAPTPDSAPRRSTPLTMDADIFRRVGHELVDVLAARLAAIPERPVTPSETPAEVRRYLGADEGLPEQGTGVRELLSHTESLLFEHSLMNAHPRFFGYITSPPAPVGILGELLAAALNANLGAWRLAPMASEIEAQTVRWIADFIGYPAGGSGLFVSGGNMANMVAVLAARAAAAGPQVRTGGMAGAAAEGLRIYASAETHTWIHKAADLSGLGTDAIRWIPTDASLRMNVAALRDALADDRSRGARPLMIVGTAGTVSTGAVDPLPELARICRDQGCWFHVDGAYGALAAAVPGAPGDLAGLAQADSVAVDPHKWLYAPLEAGCLLVRDLESLRSAFAYRPAYYHFDQGPPNFTEMGPQNSRGFRALKVWLALRQAGRAGYVRMIADDMRLSRQLHESMASHAELEVFTQALSINTFRYVPADLASEADGPAARADYLDRLNRELLERIQSSGEAFVSNAVLGDLFVLRACIVNFHTDEGDLQSLVEIVVRLGRELDAELRAGVGVL
jgi:aromatic-L-amino-acid/L-tryptophan decarboxylase